MSIDKKALFRRYTQVMRERAAQEVPNRLATLAKLHGKNTFSYTINSEINPITLIGLPVYKFEQMDDPRVVQEMFQVVHEYQKRQRPPKPPALPEPIDREKFTLGFLEPWCDDHRAKVIDLEPEELDSKRVNGEIDGKRHDPLYCGETKETYRAYFRNWRYTIKDIENWLYQHPEQLPTQPVTIMRIWESERIEKLGGKKGKLPGRLIASVLRRIVEIQQEYRKREPSW